MSDCSLKDIKKSIEIGFKELTKAIENKQQAPVRNLSGIARENVLYLLDSATDEELSVLEKIANDEDITEEQFLSCGSYLAASGLISVIKDANKDVINVEATECTAWAVARIKEARKRDKVNKGREFIKQLVYIAFGAALGSMCPALPRLFGF